jgi:hypothetical protein
MEFGYVKLAAVELGAKSIGSLYKITPITPYFSAIPI